MYVCVSCVYLYLCCTFILKIDLFAYYRLHKKTYINIKILNIRNFLFYLYKIYINFISLLYYIINRRFDLFSNVSSRTIFIRFFMFGEIDTTFSDFSFKS